MYQPTEILTSEAQLREILPDQFPSQTVKVLDEKKCWPFQTVPVITGSTAFSTSCRQAELVWCSWYEQDIAGSSSATANA